MNMSVSIQCEMNKREGREAGRRSVETASAGARWKWREEVESLGRERREGCRERRGRQ